jgi:hypothetical protein
VIQEGYQYSNTHKKPNLKIKIKNRIFIYFIKAPVIKCITDRLTQMDPTPREDEQPIEGTSGDTEIR